MTIGDLLALLPLVVLVIWALALLLVDLWIPAKRKGITALLAAVGLTVCLGLTLAQSGQNSMAFVNMAVVDGFQHWVYENHQAASDPANCDAQWATLWEQFMADEDWDGLEEERVTGWQRRLHIIQDPFYYIEYGLAQLGAFQIWRNSLADQRAALAAYRKALSLGGTVSTPQLYALAGAKFAFDEQTLQKAVDFGLETIETLESET